MASTHWDAPNAYISQLDSQFPMAMNACEPPSPTPSKSPRKRLSNWFRSRSNSFNDDAPESGVLRSRSRSKSPIDAAGTPQSPSSFVVRNVVRQSGGVTCELNLDPAATSHSYRPVVSRPLGAGMSLGVPAGGPGGGTGYGTAFSSNDGRPEAEVVSTNALNQQYRRRGSDASSRGSFTYSSAADHADLTSGMPSRPASPGSTSAGAFRKAKRPVSIYSNGGASDGGYSSDVATAEALRQRPRLSLVPFGTEADPLRGASNITEAIARQSQQAAVDSPQLQNIPGFDATAFPSLDGVTQLIAAPAALGVAESQSKNQADNSFALSSRIRGFFTSPAAGEGGDDDEENGTPYGMSTRAMGCDRPSFTSTRPALDEEDRQAEMRRRASNAEAIRLVDEERQKAVEAAALSLQATEPFTHQAHVEQMVPSMPSLPSGIAHELEAEGWSPEVLSRMTEDSRRQVIRRLTHKSDGARSSCKSPPEGEMADSGQWDRPAETEIVWDRLTPAQRIIAETRARQVRQQRMMCQVASMAEDADSKINFEAKTEWDLAALRHEDSVDDVVVAPARAQEQCRHMPVPQDSRGRQTSEEPEVPVRRRTRTRSPRKIVPDKRPQNLEENDLHEPPAEAIASQQPPQRSQTSKEPAPPSKKALKPGQGPMPSDFGGSMVEGMDDMMQRFYRFERYAVPLLRGLESRVAELESRQDRRHPEVDQMTTLMRHEIGQLRAATQELSAGREILQVLATQERQRQMNIDSSARSGRHQEQDEIITFAASETQDSIEVPQSRLVPPEDSNPPSRARSTSPIGRPMYSSALSRPMIAGRLDTHIDSPELASCQRSGPSSADGHHGRSARFGASSALSHREKSLSERLRSIADEPSTPAIDLEALGSPRTICTVEETPVLEDTPVMAQGLPVPARHLLRIGNPPELPSLLDGPAEKSGLLSPPISPNLNGVVASAGALGFLGGRTSISHAAHTRERQVPTSPNLLGLTTPAVKKEDIRIKAGANGSGLRARAQNYLSNVESVSAGNSPTLTSSVYSPNPGVYSSRLSSAAGPALSSSKENSRPNSWAPPTSSAIKGSIPVGAVSPAFGGAGGLNKSPNGAVGKSLKERMAFFEVQSN